MRSSHNLLSAAGWVLAVLLPSLLTVLGGCIQSAPAKIYGDIAMCQYSIEESAHVLGREDLPACVFNVTLDMAESAREPDLVDFVNRSVLEAAFSMTLASDEQPMDLLERAWNRYQKDYQADVEDLVSEVIQDGGDLGLEVGSWMEYTMSVRDSFQVSHSGKLLTVLVMEDNYEGGAHPSSNLTVLNLDLEYRTVLTLEDIFIEGFYEDLRDRIQERLMKDYKASDMDELEEMGIATLGPVEPTENFILSDESVTFIYNPYDIAPYSEGHIEVRLALSDLADLLK